MQYRCLQIDDYGQLLQLWRSCEGLSLRDADSIEGLRQYLARNPGLSFVAVTGGVIGGSLMAGHDGRRGYIQHLAVASDLRRSGVARQLLQLCLDALRQQGIAKSHVHVLRSNQAGRKFWAGCGFVHRSEIEMYSFINGDNLNA